jgi:hypothetical protein
VFGIVIGGVKNPVGRSQHMLYSSCWDALMHVGKVLVLIIEVHINALCCWSLFVALYMVLLNVLFIILLLFSLKFPGGVQGMPHAST